MDFQTITLLALAVLPGLFLTNFVYRRDTVDAEPLGLLWSLVALGALSAIPASILESVGEPLVRPLAGNSAELYSGLLSFLVVAVSEEGCKFVMLWLRTWKHPAFDYRFDGIVYGVMVAVGFATLENILYVLSNGYETGVARAILSVPGHVAWGVFMGYFYGRAKAFSIAGNPQKCRTNIALALLVPIVWHGAYDTCAFISDSMVIVLLAIALAGDILMVYLVRRESKNDAAFWRPLAQEGFAVYAVQRAVGQGSYASGTGVPTTYAAGAAPQQGAPQPQWQQASQARSAQPPQSPRVVSQPAYAQVQPAAQQFAQQSSPQGATQYASYPAPQTSYSPAALAAYQQAMAARYGTKPQKPFSWPMFLLTRIGGFFGVAIALFVAAIVISLAVGESNIVYDFLVYLMALMLIGAVPYLVIVLFAGGLHARRAARAN